MPRNITVTFDDGTQHTYANAPDSVSPDQITARAWQDHGKVVKHLDGGRRTGSDTAARVGTEKGRASSYGAPAAPEVQPAAPKPRSFGDELIRQVGLTARYAMEGLPQMADLVAMPIRAGLNAANGALGGNPEYFQPLSSLASRGADKLGLPQPENAAERVIGDASRAVAGSAGSVGLARAVAAQAGAPVVKAVAQKMAADPMAQGASGATGAAAGSATREEGGTPMGQFAASLVGGIAGGAALNAGRSAANAAGAAARKALDPQQLDATLKTTLERAGMSWDDLGAAAKIQLRRDAEKVVYSGQPIDAAALKRLADFRAVGATPLVGDITQDPGLLTLQRNLAKTQANGSGELPHLQNANAGRVLDTLQRQADSPLDAYATGERIISTVQGKDAALKAGEKALYDRARGAAGREVQLDRGQFVNEAFANLAATNRQAFLPESVGKVLDQIAAGTVKVGGQEHPVPFDVNTIDQLKTILASASRATMDGNAKAAIKAVRDALENTQIAASKPATAPGSLATGAQAAAMQQADTAPAEALAWFDKARGAARDRRTWQESAKFIEAALDGAAPDDFVRKHIIGAPVGELQKLKAEITRAAAAPGASSRELSTAVNPGGLTAPSTGGTQQRDIVNAVRKQMVDYIMKRGRADGDVRTFSSAGMKDALQQLGDRKLAMFFSADEIQQIKSAVNVGRYMQSQPIGSAVNNSNSGAMLWGRLSNVLGHLSGIPGAGPLAAAPLQQFTTSMQVRTLRDLSRGLTTPEAAPGTVAPALVPLSLLFAQGREDQARP